MPMGATGRNAEYLDLQPVKERLRARFGLIETTIPARACPLSGTSDAAQRRLITPISQHFCQTCNRVRIAVDGTPTCAWARRDIRIPPAAARRLFRFRTDAGDRRSHQPQAERHEFREGPGEDPALHVMTGG